MSVPRPTKRRSVNGQNFHGGMAGIVVPNAAPRVPAKAVPCPECKAAVDEKCISNATGLPVTSTHMPRRRMATRAFNEATLGTEAVGLKVGFMQELVKFSNAKYAPNSEKWKFNGTLEKDKVVKYRCAHMHDTVTAARVCANHAYTSIRTQKEVPRNWAEVDTPQQSE